MEKKKTYFIIDAGNTRIKTAYFQDDTLTDLRVFSNDELNQLKQFLLCVKCDKALISSVRSKKDTNWLQQFIPAAVLFQQIKEYPIGISYETPQTLGADRLANCIAAFSLVQANALVVDLGTCIKFDFVDLNGVYQGGSIAPGLEMRFKAMHHFTGNLPLISKYEPVDLISKSTQTCLQSGVMNGMRAEIQGLIEEYEKNVHDLTVFVTGGDSRYFDFHSKKPIFALENLTLVGLYNTLKAYAI
jgi:type III pantothenate kinase